MIPKTSELNIRKVGVIPFEVKSTYTPFISVLRRILATRISMVLASGERITLTSRVDFWGGK
jgi:hypothetical protein